MQQDNLPAEGEAIDEALRILANKRGRPVLCLFGRMGTKSVQEVRSLAGKLKEFDTLSILLHSPGGDIEDAYRMVLALREYAEDIEVLVPRWAKSAATFFCLAADTIYMGRHGELGPLDPQMLDLRGSAMRKSPLESFQALDHLLNFSLESLDAVVQQLLSKAPMDIPHAIEHAKPFFAEIVSPLYSKVDLHELGDAGRVLAISEDYAIRVMGRWGYSDIEREDVQLIARRLVWDYPTHGFVIDLFEARSIGLKARRLEEESEAICWEILESTEDTEDYINVTFPDAQGLQADSGDEREGYEGEADDAGLQPEGATGEAGSRRSEGSQKAEAVREGIP